MVLFPDPLAPYTSISDCLERFKHTMAKSKETNGGY